MFSWVHQFLSMIHCTLFHDSDPSSSFDSKGQYFSWGVEVENAFQSLKSSFTIAHFLFIQTLLNWMLKNGCF